MCISEEETLHGTHTIQCSWHLDFEFETKEVVNFCGENHHKLKQSPEAAFSITQCLRKIPDLPLKSYPCPSLPTSLLTTYVHGVAQPLSTGFCHSSSPRRSLEALNNPRLLIFSHPYSFPCCAKLCLIKASKILALANQKYFKPYLG